MDIRSAMDKVKSVFTVGSGNRWLLGDSAKTSRKAQYEEPQPDYGYGEYPEYPQNGYAPQPDYQANYQPPQQVYPDYQPGYAGYAPQQSQPGYAPGYQAPPAQQPQQGGYVQNTQQPVYQQAENMGFQTQFSPKGHQQPQVQPQRNRRAQQHEQQAPAENVVPFPGAPQEAPAEVRPMDAYVINVFNIQACRQAMACLRRGQCTLIIMDQLTDRNETRRFVDMLTGACYALGGTMTRLSTKIGFYLMAPTGMTVFTDAVTSNANNPRPAAQAPLRTGNDFVPQSAPETPPMNFNQQQPVQQAPQQEYQPQHQAAPAYSQPNPYQPPQPPSYQPAYQGGHQGYENSGYYEENQRYAQ